MDPSGDHTGIGQSGTDDPAAGAHGGCRSNRPGHRAVVARGPPPATHARGDRRRQRLDLERVQAALEAPGDTVSLDRPVGDDGDAELQDFVEDERTPDPFVHTVDVLRRQHLVRALSVLDEDEKQVILLRFGLDGGEPRTLSEVGKVFNLTRSGSVRLRAEG